MEKTNKTREQELWTAFLRFTNSEAYSLRKAVESKAEAYANAGDENAADALFVVARYLEQVDDLLSERELDYALGYLDEFDDTLADNEKSYLNNFCGN